MAIAIPVRKGLIGVLLVIAFFTANAQEVAPDRCGTMKLLEKRFAEHPALKARFESREKPFQQLVNQRIQQANSGAEKAEAFLTVPVVFHIVLADPSQVTNA